MSETGEVTSTDVGEVDAESATVASWQAEFEERYGGYAALAGFERDLRQRGGDLVELYEGADLDVQVNLFAWVVRLLRGEANHWRQRRAQQDETLALLATERDEVRRILDDARVPLSFRVDRRDAAPAVVFSLTERLELLVDHRDALVQRFGNLPDEDE